jgi:c-di-GMP-binding flagellar brake protein YcgR
MAGQERRTFPRVRDEGLSLKLNSGDFDTVTHTLDISASGIYCKIDKEIPLMSKVRLKLMVPESSKAVRELDVDGVVVREHPVIIDGVIRHYDAAIFFDNLSPKNREMIQAYIASKGRGE